MPVHLPVQGDAGAIALVESLQDSSIQMLHLSNNDITDTGEPNQYLSLIDLHHLVILVQEVPVSGVGMSVLAPMLLGLPELDLLFIGAWTQ